MPDNQTHVIRANEVEATEAKVLEFPAPHTRVEPDTTHPSGASDASRMLADYRVGRNAGYEAGYAAGQQVARDEVAAALQAVREAVEQLATAAGQRTTGIAELASALAVDLAREILQRELREDGSFGSDVVRQALSVANIEDSITIVMNPLEAELCAAPEQVTIIGDERVPRTHAEVRIGSSIIDFGIDTA
ncbi:MAG: FliH/SctL family protein, partial [Ilumatobacteraceae bacterium]